MKRWTLLFLAFLSVLSMKAQSYEYGKLRCADGDTLLYRYLTPEKTARQALYPLVLYLHTSGERGNDNEGTIFGAQMFLNPVNREDYPCLVIVPQCPENHTWAFDVSPGSYDFPKDYPESKIMKEVMELVHLFLQRPDVDPDRVYIYGMSMGGIGAFDAVARHPDIFAAAVPICGDINPDRLGKFEGVSFSLYHGDSDPAVPVSGSRDAYRALKAAGADVRYHEFPGCGHVCWWKAFEMPDFMEWLFSKSKAKVPAQDTQNTGM